MFLLSSADSCRNIHIYAGYIPTQWTTDARRKTQEDFFNKYLPLTLLQGFEKVVWGFTVRGSWRPNITEIFWPQSYGRQRCVFLVLLWTPIQSGLPRAPSDGCGFPYHISPHTGTRTQLSSVQFVGLILPSNSHAEIWTRLHVSAISSDIWRSGCVTFRYLWNGLCDRHRVEITVMQFTGHLSSGASVYECTMGIFYLVDEILLLRNVNLSVTDHTLLILTSLSAGFTSQFPPMRFPLITAIRMCHFLPVHHLEWHFGPGQKVKI